MLNKVVKRDLKRRKRIEAAGIEYQCPELVSIRFHSLLHYIYKSNTEAEPRDPLPFGTAYRLEIHSHYLRRSSLVKTSNLKAVEERTHIFDKLLFLYGIWFIVLPTSDRELNFIAMKISVLTSQILCIASTYFKTSGDRFSILKPLLPSLTETVAMRTKFSPFPTSISYNSANTCLNTSLSSS